MKDRPFNVLLIEDNAASERKVREMLAGSPSFKFNCHREDSLENGLARLNDGEWDVALVDLGPAGREANDALSRLRSVAPRLPIILLAGGSDVDADAGVIPEGAQDLLDHDRLDTGLLSHSICKAIHRKRSEDEKHALTDNLLSVNRRLKETQAELVNSERLAAVGHLAAGVAHEINNPAAFVLSNLGTLQRYLNDLTARYHQCRQALMEHAPPELARSFTDREAEADLAFIEQDAKELIEESLGGMKRIRDIVASLQSFAVTGRAELTPLDMNEVLESVVTVLSNQIEFKAVLQKELNPLPPIMGDRAKLAQVLLNIILNAVQSIPEGDKAGNTITVRTRAAGENVVITVADSGPGIDPKAEPRIFDPFFTTRPLGHAAGLGLTIAQETVRRHQGRIEVRNGPGRGAVFQVFLPAAGPAAEPAAPATRPERADKHITARVLIVDDEPHILRSYSRAMPVTISTVTAGSGAEAIEIIARDPDFDVIVCDLMMPDLSGIEVYQRAVSRYPRLAGRFLFVTGGAYTDKTADFIRQMKNQLLKKPFAIQELISAIGSIMKTRKIQTS